MSAEETLNKVQEEYYNNRMFGYNRIDSATEAVNKVFKGVNNKPHIYLDKYEDASHIFLKDCVLFFETREIYKLYHGK